MCPAQDGGARGVYRPESISFWLEPQASESARTQVNTLGENCRAKPERPEQFT
jgi:hypothetical protein